MTRPAGPLTGLTGNGVRLRTPPFTDRQTTPWGYRPCSSHRVPAGGHAVREIAAYPGPPGRVDFDVILNDHTAGAARKAWTVLNRQAGRTPVTPGPTAPGFPAALHKHLAPSRITT